MNVNAPAVLYPRESFNTFMTVPGYSFTGENPITTTKDDCLKNAFKLAEGRR